MDNLEERLKTNLKEIDTSLSGSSILRAVEMKEAERSISDRPEGLPSIPTPAPVQNATATLASSSSSSSSSSSASFETSSDSDSD